MSKLDPATLRLKEFVENHIPFEGLKKVGFFEKGIRRTDYQKIADRICWFFGFKEIYEYALINADQVDKDGNFIISEGYHLSVLNTDFECPYCTCFNPGVNHAEKLGNKFQVNVKCDGCKRNLLYSINPFRNIVKVEPINKTK